jgi:hypothetical protein
LLITNRGLNMTLFMTPIAGRSALTSPRPENVLMRSASALYHSGSSIPSFFPMSARSENRSMRSLLRNVLYARSEAEIGRPMKGTRLMKFALENHSSCIPVPSPVRARPLFRASL